MIIEVINLAVSWALFGLIWTIQLVHYPAFKFIDDKQFTAFHQHHTQSITVIVMPLMLAELGLAAYLVYLNGIWAWWVQLGIVLLLWILTFFFAIPLHNRLGKGKNLSVIQQLVNLNWPRTLLWTIKAIGVTWWMLVDI